MEHPRKIIFQLLIRLKKHFDENRASRIQIALLATFFALLAWIAGVLAGSLLAFFVVALTPGGPERGWPALYALIGCTLLIGVSGTVKAWQMYQHKVSER